MTEARSHKQSLTIYLLLANGITWLCWIPGLLFSARYGVAMPRFDTYATLFESGFANTQHLWLGIVFTLGVYGPLIAGLIATRMDGGRDGLADMWRRIIKWRIGWRWYATALVIAFIMPAIPVGIFALFRGTGASIGGAMTLSYVLLLFVIQLLTSGLGEEPGWRGYLLPRLQARYSGGKTIWMLGLIWAVWHYPIVIVQTFSMMQDVSMLQIVITSLVSLLGQTISLIGITYIYVWLYNHTQSVLLAIIFHALSNVFSYWLASYLAQPQTVTLLIAVMPWLVVAVLQRSLGKGRFPGSPCATESTANER